MPASLLSCTCAHTPQAMSEACPSLQLLVTRRTWDTTTTPDIAAGPSAASPATDGTIPHSMEEIEQAVAAGLVALRVPPLSAAAAWSLFSGASGAGAALARRLAAGCCGLPGPTLMLGAAYRWVGVGGTKPIDLTICPQLDRMC